MSTIFTDEEIAEKYRKKFPCFTFIKDDSQDADYEFGSSCVFNPRSLGSSQKPNFVKATAEDYYLWEKDNSYLPRTSNHEFFNVVDFHTDIKGDIGALDIVNAKVLYPLTNPYCRLSIWLVDGKLYASSESKFNKNRRVEVISESITYEVLDCPSVEKIEYSASAISDISQYAYLAYKAIKQGSKDWYKHINNAWARERTEYLYKGKIILADNKIAELVSTTALCARPDNDKLVVINK